MPTPLDQRSIFGPTADGVPSPNVAHVHPYPTRYHGPIWWTPKFGLPYRSNPMAVAPYAGLGGCGCKGGMGDVDLPSMSTVLKTALGATAGYAFAPGDNNVWAVAGAAAGGLFGWLGVVGIVAAAYVAGVQERGRQ